MKTFSAYAVPTRANTKFMPWWEQLNAEVTKLNLPEPGFGEAKGYYELGYCPRTAASNIEATS